LSFDSLAPKTYGDAPFALNAQLSSGEAITYSSSNTDVAVVIGQSVRIVGAGTTVITATAAEINTHGASISQSRTWPYHLMVMASTLGFRNHLK
jgi:hypothetical protein